MVQTVKVLPKGGLDGALSFLKIWKGIEKTDDLGLQCVLQNSTIIPVSCFQQSIQQGHNNMAEYRKFVLLSSNLLLLRDLYTAIFR